MISSMFLISSPSADHGCLKPGFHLDIFCFLLLVLVFRSNKKPQRAMRCSNWTIHKKPKQATKSHNEQQKEFACFAFEIESILSQKQERATKSSKRQRKANGNTHQKPKRATKKQQRAFFIPISIHSHQFWTYGRWLISRAMTSQKEQRRATKS